MASQPIEPLRISKGSSPMKSPNKFSPGSNKALSELSPMALRRNSPSFPGNKVNLAKADSSPFGSSPVTGISTASPRLFWQGRDPASPSRENQSPFDPKTNVVTKRSSIEKLKQASRVKNSNIFAKEQSINYDPAKPVVVDRPLAKRPLSSQVQGNAFGGQGIHGLRTHNDKWADPDVEETVAEDDIAPMAAFAPLSPSKHNTSPGKSSLSKKTGSDARYSGFDPGNAIWADDDPSEKKLPEGRVLHRHAKSVTFDQAPPQVNEYEMTTPDPSSVASGSREGSYDSADEEDLSFERGSSLDRDDSFDASLEDTDKTPVVLPEDWRFMSPEAANTDLAQHEEDVFTEDDYGSPAPTAQPGMTESRSHQTSLNSVDSNGQARPLPPLPQAAEDFSSAIERMSNAQRSLPSPPKAISVSKSDIRRMSGGSMSLEERLRLMMLKEQEQEKPEAEKQRERRMRRAGSKDPSPTRENLYNQDGVEEDEDGSPGPAVIEPESKSPQISRESILRQLRSHQDLNEVDYDSVPMPKYDPDVPIPSLEDPTLPAHRQQQVVIKQEEANDDDLYSIPDMYAAACGDSESEETTSQYSQTADPSANPIAHENGQETPRARSPAKEPRRKVETSQRPSLPDFTDFGRHTSFDLDLSSYMTPPTELGNSDKSIESDPPQAALPDLSVLRASIQRPFTPQEKLEPPSFSMSREYNSAEPGTPDSVIRHPVEEHVLSEIASPDASVKAPGARLNIRPSPAPADTQTMAAVRRQVSGQVQVPDESTEPAKATETLQDHTAQPIETKDLPPEPETPTNSDMSESTEVREANPRLSSLVQLEIPRDQSDEGPGLGLEKEFDRVVETQKVEFELSLQHLYYPFHGRFPSSELPDSKGTKMKNPLDNVPILPRPRGARALPGDQPAHGHIYPTDGSLFANRSPYRQRGYLMRQNTKVVVASERASQDEARPTSSANLTAEASNAPEANPNEVQVSPRKTSQPAWTAEPWVGKSRRKSIRVGGETSPIKRKPVDSVAPPLPGQASNVSHAITEDDIAEDEAEDLEDGTERGRVFVKVVGVKDLDLPLPTYERTSFALTLDNGLHCVTTAWLDLAKKAPIGQEFELVVLNDLEFQLTLQMKLEEPRVERPASPTKALASPKKPGAFGRLFGSPKKRKESEAKAQQELAKRPVTPPSAYEMVKGLVAKDGSFARAYVALSEHEKQAYGRPYTVDIMCFNEWAMEEVSVGSSRSKKAVTELQRRPPYQIGKLELQLLYVPKPKGCKDEDMPKSMNSAVRELKEAETKMAQQMKEFEGHLSQQGGDCPYWRRRFFKLSGTRLTAYHESTLQPRATINLVKAAKLIDDKNTLLQKEISTKGGGRRKSAFAEEEEGYMFVEEGFRIRFANGEVIDFYADSTPEKEEWMKVLYQVVGKNVTGTSGPVKPWAETILRREKSVVAKEKKARANAPPVPKLPKNDALTREQTVVRNPNAANKGMPFIEQSNLRSQQPSSIPSPTRAALRPQSPTRTAPRPQSPTKPAPRPQAHARTESYQPPAAGAKSQASSPVKTRMTAEDRQKKTRSMIF